MLIKYTLVRIFTVGEAGIHSTLALVHIAKLPKLPNIVSCDYTWLQLCTIYRYNDHRLVFNTDIAIIDKYYNYH